MKWLSMSIVVMVSAICITVTFWAARRTERTQMTGRPALPELSETLSVLVDHQGRILELRSEGRPLQVQGNAGPLTWQDLEPYYDIVSARWIKDDEHGQIELLELRLRAKEH